MDDGNRKSWQTNGVKFLLSHIVVPTCMHLAFMAVLWLHPCWGHGFNILLKQSKFQLASMLFSAAYKYCIGRFHKKIKITEERTRCAMTCKIGMLQFFSMKYQLQILRMTHLEKDFSSCSWANRFIKVFLHVVHFISVRVICFIIWVIATQNQSTLV